MTAWLDADWPAPPGVRALTTLRHGLGVSQSPFDHFNLGSRCGDDADAVNKKIVAAFNDKLDQTGLYASIDGTNIKFESLKAGQTITAVRPQ